MKGFVLSMLWLQQFSIHAQPAGESSYGLAAFAPGFRDVFTTLVQPAALADIKKISGGVYSEQPFLIPEWTRGAGVIAVPSTFGNFGFALFYSGARNFTDSRLELTYARKLGEHGDAGISLLYKNRAFKTYGKETDLGYAAGFTFRVNSKFHSGFRIANADQLSDEKQKFSKLPGQFTAGFAWLVSKLFFLTASVEKQQDDPVNFSTGFHYAFDERIFFRAGMVTAQPGWFMATGIKWKSFVFQFTGNVHHVLGLTPGLLLLIKPETK